MFSMYPDCVGNEDRARELVPAQRYQENPDLRKSIKLGAIPFLSDRCTSYEVVPNGFLPDWTIGPSACN